MLYSRPSLIVQLVKNPPAIQETVVQFLGREDPLEKGQATPVFLGFPVAQLVRICLQCGRPGFDPWVGKIPWTRERLPTLVFWPGEFHGLYGPWGRKESDTTERLSLSLQVEHKNTRQTKLISFNTITMQQDSSMFYFPLPENPLLNLLLFQFNNKSPS